MNLPPTENTQEPPQEEFSEFTNQYLSVIPEQDRPIVAKYVKDWDKNVTHKFQEYSGKLKPYEELGSVEDIIDSLSWVAALNSDPKKFYEDLTNLLAQEGILEMSNVEPTTPPVGKEDEFVNEYEGIPDSFVKTFKAMEDRLAQIDAKETDRASREEEAANQAALDNYLAEMHTEYGEFNDKFIIAQLASGLEAKEAIEEWNAILKQNGTPKSTPPPAKILSGGGATPKEQVDWKAMSRNDKKDMMIQALIAAKGD